MSSIKYIVFSSSFCFNHCNFFVFIIKVILDRLYTFDNTYLLYSIYFFIEPSCFLCKKMGNYHEVISIVHIIGLKQFTVLFMHDTLTKCYGSIKRCELFIYLYLLVFRKAILNINAIFFIIL